MGKPYSMSHRRVRQPAGQNPSSGQMAGHEMPVAALLQFGRAFPAARLGDRAAGVKMTAARRVHRARHVALQADPLALHLRVRHRHGGEQRLGIGMLRIAVELARVGQLDDAAEIHHRHAVGNVLHHGEIVGDEQIGQVELGLQILQQVDHLRLDRHVERGNRLVAHDELRLHRERARDHDALALAAGEFVRVAAHVLGLQSRP